MLSQKIYTLVSKNAGDKKDLHSGGREFFNNLTESLK